MAPLKLPQGFRCRLFGSTASSLDLTENVVESSTQLLPPMTPVEGEVAGAACDGSADPLIVLSTDNEGSTALRPICLSSDSDAVHVNDDAASSSAKRKRTSETRSRYDANRHFQDHWAARLPWAEPELDSDGVLVAVKCTVCSVINGKPKLIVPKWDNLEKHMGKRRASQDLPKKNLKNGALCVSQATVCAGAGEQQRRWRESAKVCAILDFVPCLEAWAADGGV